MYTRQITFTTIASQRAGSEAKEIKDDDTQNERKPGNDPEGLMVPPPGTIWAEPCSPKSVYCLASKVCLAPLPNGVVTNSFFVQIGLTGLCDIAFEDVQSKLDKDNIVQELFSPFAAE